MAFPDWKYVTDQLATRRGEDIESLVAALLRARYVEARQTNSAGGGDGGIDVLRKTESGTEVWQVKKYSSPLDHSQKSAVRRSWNKFVKRSTEKEMTVSRYTLVTPWTPTDAHVEWFDKLTADAPYPCSWDADALLNGLISEFPMIYARFTGGEEHIGHLITEAALAIAGTKGLDLNPFGPPALSARGKIHGLLGSAESLNYYVDYAQISRDPGAPIEQFLGQTRGVFHSVLDKGDGRYEVASIVPKPGATQLNLSVRFDFEVVPESDQARQFEEWLFWGVPLVDFPAVVTPAGGPFDGAEPEESLVTMDRSRKPDPGSPAIVLSKPGARKSQLQLLRFTVTALSSGSRGGGRRLVAISDGGVVALDVRLGSTEARDAFAIRMVTEPGADAKAFLAEVASLSQIAHDEIVTFSIAGGDDFGTASGLSAPSGIELALEVARSVVELEKHLPERVGMPDLREVTNHELAYAHEVLAALAGQAEAATWLTWQVTVIDAAAARASLRKGGTVAIVREATVILGGTKYPIDGRVARVVEGVEPPSEQELKGLKSGSKLVLRAAPGATQVLSIVREPEGDG